MKANVIAEAKCIYLQLVKKEARKFKKFTDAINTDEELCTIIRMTIRQQISLKPPLWSGMYGDIKLVNTCIIYNMLYLMHPLFTFRRDILDEFTNFTHTQVLVQVYQ